MNHSFCSPSFFSCDMSVYIFFISALMSPCVFLAILSIVSLSSLNILNFISQSLCTGLVLNAVFTHMALRVLHYFTMIPFVVLRCFFSTSLSLSNYQRSLVGVYVGERLFCGCISSCLVGRLCPSASPHQGMQTSLLCKEASCNKAAQVP